MEPSHRSHLLRLRGGLGLDGGAARLLAREVLVRPRGAQDERRAALLLRSRDRASLLLELLLRERDDLLVRVLRHRRHLGARAVALLRLALPRDHEELALVELEPRRVLLEALGAAVLPAVVHRDAHRRRELLRDARRLELIEREATAEASLGVVALRRRLDDRLQKPGGGPRRHLRRLLLSRRAAGLL